MTVTTKPEPDEDYTDPYADQEDPDDAWEDEDDWEETGTL